MTEQDSKSLISIYSIVGILILVGFAFFALQHLTEQGGKIEALQTRLDELSIATAELKDQDAKFKTELELQSSLVNNFSAAITELRTTLEGTQRSLFNAINVLAQKFGNSKPGEAFTSKDPLSLAPLPVDPKPKPLNIDFGAWRPAPSKMVGAAAVGSDRDFWNTVAVAWNHDHQQSGLRWADGTDSAARARLVNLGGGWGNSMKMGVKSPMLDSFNYPANNRGGNSQVILSNLPAGMYDLYIYGHGTDPMYYGDYTVTTLGIGGKSYGRRATSNQEDAITSKIWEEGKQYVKFSAIELNPGAEIEILIQPGGQVSDNGVRQFTDAMICGLQLVPAGSGMGRRSGI